MKISDVLNQIAAIVDSAPTERSSGDNTSKFTAFTGDLTPVELPEEDAEELRRPKKMPSGNDAIPDDLYLPPLQLKSELLKKAVDVENIFSDGTPAVRYDEEYGEEGWHGDEDEHTYIGAPWTAEQLPDSETEQPDPNEELTDLYGSDSSDDERERSDESLDRILHLANVREAKQHWDKDMYDSDDAAKKDKKGSIVKRRKDAVAEDWDNDWDDEDDGDGHEWQERHDSLPQDMDEGWDDYDDFDADVERADRELSRLGRSPIKAAVIDLDKDELHGDDDWDDEQLDELSPKTLGSYVKKANMDAMGGAEQWGRGDEWHGPGTAKNAFKKALKRSKGIDKAVDRLTREDMADECSMSESAKPDYLDADGDGDKKEPMKKAFKDKEKEVNEAQQQINRMRELAGLNAVVLDELTDDNAV